MHKDEDESEVVTVELSRSELTVMRNALDEVCNGPELDEWDFETRMGATQVEAETLLNQMSLLLEQTA